MKLKSGFYVTKVFQKLQRRRAMSKSRKKQEINRKDDPGKYREEKLESRNSFNNSDPTPRLAMLNIIREGKLFSKYSHI